MEVSVAGASLHFDVGGGGVTVPTGLNLNGFLSAREI